MILYIILRTSVRGGLNVLWFYFQSRFKRKKESGYLREELFNTWIYLVSSIHVWINGYLFRFYSFGGFVLTTTFIVKPKELVSGAVEYIYIICVTKTNLI